MSLWITVKLKAETCISHTFDDHPATFSVVESCFFFFFLVVGDVLLDNHWRGFTAATNSSIKTKIKTLVCFCLCLCMCMFAIIIGLAGVFFSGSFPPVGVSNWGGYAVACGLYLLHTCPSHQRYLKKALGGENTTSQEQLQDWAANLPSVDKVTHTLV